MVGRTTVSSSGSTGSESFVLIWVHFLNSVGCRFNNQRRGLFLDRVRHQRTVLKAAWTAPAPDAWHGGSMAVYLQVLARCAPVPPRCRQSRRWSHNRPLVVSEGCHGRAEVGRKLYDLNTANVRSSDNNPP